ncbi:ABC transporter permease [Aquamicrobium ahrensii]
MMNWLAGLALRATIVAILGFLLAPLVVIVVVSFGDAAFMQFPPKGLSFRWYANIDQLEGFFDAVVISLKLAVLSTVIVLVLGVAASLALTRHRFAGRGAAMSLFLSPLMLPSIVIGIGLLQYYTSLGFFSTFTALVLGHCAIVFPYMVRTVASSLEQQDESVIEASRVLGADAVQTFAHIIVPSIRPGLINGAIFAFIMSFDNYSVSLFLSDAATQTLPIRMLTYVAMAIDPTVAAASTLLILFSMLQLLVAGWLIGVRRIGGLAGK